MKKQLITKIVSIVVALALGATVMAAYYKDQAAVTLFSGRVEPFGCGSADEDGPELLLEIADKDAGQYCDITKYGQSSFPILTNVTDTKGTGELKDVNGRTPLVAPTFVLKARGGDFDYLTAQIMMYGDMTTSEALKFGFTAKYYSADGTNYATSVGFLDSQEVDSATRCAKTECAALGGCLVDGGRIEITISAWVDSDIFLSNLNDEYKNDIVNVDVVFSGNPITQS